MKGRQKNEMPKIVTRQKRTSASDRATASPPSSRRMPVSAGGLLVLHPARERDPGDHDDGESVGGGVDREDAPRGHQGEQEPADGRADDPGQVHLHRLQGHRAGQVAAGHQRREHGGEGRRVEGVADTDGEHAGEHQQGRRVGPRRRPGQGQGEHQLLDLARDQESSAVDHVGQGTAEDGEEEERAELGEAEERRRRWRSG